MYKELGFVRVGAIVPSLSLANPKENVKEIVNCLREAEKQGISIAVTPELSLVGYTCQDLFQDSLLQRKTLFELDQLLKRTKMLQIVFIVGMPLAIKNKLYNVAVVIQRGELLGIVPKSYLPNSKEFYEKRWFVSGAKIENEEIEVLGRKVPFGTNLIFEDFQNKNISFAIELCEDLWVPNPPSTKHSQNGATIIFNLSASNEIVGKHEYRKNLVAMQSARTNSAYVYASAGANESTSDIVFSGNSIIAENGKILEENDRFSFESNIITKDIDVDNLMHDRMQNTNFNQKSECNNYRKIGIKTQDTIENLNRYFSKHPFIPSGTIESNSARYNEIVMIQAVALTKRMKATGIQKLVIGLSGGLDSTYAFLVMTKACELLKLDNRSIIAITMPGFGTSTRTLKNAKELAKVYDVQIQEIDITKMCKIEMKNIGISEDDRSVTFENIQARARTEILMNNANKQNALVIGTGDLSEGALGWCTYNGDHMSMYAINNSIPKTLVQYLVKYFISTEIDTTRRDVLQDILDTKISPELLPPKNGEISQKTEDIIGSYTLHDFFLYHFIRYGESPRKIYVIANNIFDEFKEEEIFKTLKTFINRFFTQQFKRNCMPDGPKVGSISLSPRGDLRMPSDAQRQMWITDLEEFVDEKKMNDFKLR